MPNVRGELRALTVLCRADCTARFRARARPVPAVRARAARCTRERVELSLTLSNVKDQTCTVEVFNTNNITTIGIINNNT